MHVRIDDLLRLRDGERVAPDVVTHVQRCAACAGELEAVRERTAALRRLPDPAVPAHTWSAIRARLDAALPGHEQPVPRMRRAPAALAGFAAALAILQILDAPARLRGPAGPGRAGPDSELPRLLAESQQLEAVLAALPAGPEIVRARRVDAIRSLEESIASVDRQLALRADAGDGAQPQLWRRRVGLMQSLVQVRLADVRGAAL